MVQELVVRRLHLDLAISDDERIGATFHPATT
jgi:hypothetical protein